MNQLVIQMMQMAKRSIKLLTAVFAVVLTFCGQESRISAQDKVNFEDHVRPIFREKCFSCHNTNKKSSDLDLSSFSSLMQGGASGAVIEPGAAENSYLFMLMTHESEPFMPPNADRVPDAMLEVVRRWIDSGAPETAASRVMLPKKPAVSLSVDVAAGVRPDGPAAMPDVLNLEPVVHTAATTAVTAIATSPWAKLIAVAGQKQVVLYHSETMEPLGVLGFPEGQPRVLKFSRSGTLLLAGGGHGAARGLAVVWDVRTGERVMEVGDELDEVLAADISADQTMVAVGGPERVVRVYSTATNELVYEVTKHTDWIYSLEFSPDSVLLATSDRSGGLHVWESHTGREYLTLTGHTSGVHAVSWRIDGNVLASASEDGSIKLWEMENGNQIKSWAAHGGGAFCTEFCRDGRIVSSGRDRLAKLWDQNGTEIRQFEAFDDLALRVSHCDETDRVIAGDWTGEIRLWNAADGTQLGTLSTNPPLLETRITLAEALIPEAEGRSAEQQNQLTAARDLQATQQTKVDTAAKILQDAERLAAARSADLKSADDQLTASEQQAKQLTDSVSALRKAIPELQSAAQKAGEVSAVLSTDEELKKLTEQLNAQVAARAATLAEQETLLKETEAQKQQLAEKVAGLKQQLTKDEEAVAGAKATVDSDSARLVELQQAAAVAETQAEEAQAELQRVQGLVQRWKHYQSLRDELATLNATQKLRDERQLAALEAEAVLAEMQQETQQQRQVLAAAEKRQADAQQMADSLKTELAELEVKQLDQQQQLRNSEQAVPKLKAALEQAQAVEKLLPGDAEVSMSVEGLAALAGRQEQRLKDLKASLASLTEKMGETKDGIAKASVLEEAAVVELQQTEQQIARLNAEAEPLKQAVTETQTDLQQAEQQVQQAEEVVAARRDQIRPQLQLSQAASQ